MNIRLSFLSLPILMIVLAGGTNTGLVLAQKSGIKLHTRWARTKKASTDSRRRFGCSYTGGDDSNEHEASATDMSGAYSGTVNAADLKLQGKVKLSIDKNRFTLVGDKWTRTGRVVATTTDRYTAVVFAFPVETQTGPQYKVFSVEAASTKTGNRISFNSVCGENSNFSLTLTTDRDNMYDVHFVTEPATTTVNIITDLKWHQCQERDKDIKKCPWKAAGDPEKMLGIYHYFVEWSDGRSKNGELEVTSDKTFHITAP